MTTRFTARARASTRPPFRGLASALAFGTLVLAGCAGEDALRAVSDEARPPAVEAVLARSGSLPSVERVTGVVRARNQVVIRPEIEAPVSEVLVRNGDVVKAGDPLVRLSDIDERERIRNAEAALAVSRAGVAEAEARIQEIDVEIRRVRTLAGQRIVSPLERETLEARLTTAEAQAQQGRARVAQAQSTLEERRAALARTVVRAPVDGRVGRRDVEVGQLVDASDVLFVIGDPERLIVEVPLTETTLTRVGPGTPVQVQARGVEPVRARLSRISPFLEMRTFSTTGEIDVDNADGRLRPGTFATVDLFQGQSGESTLVPASALWEDARTGELTVWVVTEPSALDPKSRVLSAEPLPIEQRPVELLGSSRGVAGVRGIAPGDWVVIVGQHLLERDAGAEDGPPAARVRPADWERVIDLQDLQREDLLRRFLEKQRRVAAAFGSEIPDDPVDVEEIEPETKPTAATAVGTEPLGG